MFYIKRNLLVITDSGIYYIWHPVFSGIKYIAPLVNKAGYTSIGRTGNAPAGFNRPQRSISQMLLMTGCITPPSIIGDNSQKIGSFVNIACYKISVNRFK